MGISRALRPAVERIRTVSNASLTIYVAITDASIDDARAAVIEQQLSFTVEDYVALPSR